jgi:hypothetical protein
LTKWKLQSIIKVETEKELSIMATKSVLKDVVIKDKNAILGLVNALEHAAKKSSAPIRKTKSSSYATAAEIRDMFGKKTDDGV